MTTALVTGAGKRLGRAMALELARRGYDVAVHYASSEAEAEAVVQEISGMGQRAVAVQADLLIEAEVEALLPHAEMTIALAMPLKRRAGANGIHPHPGRKRLCGGLG